MLEKIMKERNLTNRKIMELTGFGEVTIIRAKKNIEVLKFQHVIDICNALHISIDSITVKAESYDKFQEMQKIEEYTDSELIIFTENEKKYLCTMLNGSIYNKEILPRTYLRMQIIDSDDIDGLGAKWSVNIKYLESKIRKLSQYQCYRIICIIREWWQKPEPKNINQIL